RSVGRAPPGRSRLLRTAWLAAVESAREERDRRIVRLDAGGAARDGRLAQVEEAADGQSLRLTALEERLAAHDRRMDELAAAKIEFARLEEAVEERGT